MILVVVDYANGGRGYARIERDKASLGVASLSAAVRQCQVNGETRRSGDQDHPSTLRAGALRFPQPQGACGNGPSGNREEMQRL